jgi:DegT/DnrJ/EryC1/StrS aminotransferase family
MSRIHLSKADVTQVEEQYVLDAIRSGWVAPLGPDVDAFEAEIATRTGVSHALALASGSMSSVDPRSRVHFRPQMQEAWPATVTVEQSLDQLHDSHRLPEHRGGVLV